MRIVILTTEGDKANILYHRLDKTYDIANVFMEKPVPRSRLIKKRIKKMGIRKVVGQILFKIMIAKKLEHRSFQRIQQIISENQLDSSPIPEEKIINVTSVNDANCIKRLQELKPDMVIVHGTRIISKEVLQSVEVPFINMHAGITPFYRGVHGGYWALANQDPDHCGVTIHLIDEGIDTGGVIYQSVISVTPEDNFITYPYLQFAMGLCDMIKVIEDFMGEGIKTHRVDLPSMFRTHPTLWEYRFYKKKYGVK